MRIRARSLALILWSSVFACGARDLPSGRNGDFLTVEPFYFVTNVAQFRTLSGGDYLDRGAFHLTGVVTLVDTDRDLVVMQDATGALALNAGVKYSQIRVGQLVSFDGTNCFPYVAGFPDYPYRPTGQELRTSFETPRDWGEYHLTRMQGYLHPPVTGDYTFWIASDNSSELYLSPDDDPSKIRRIAFVARYNWTAPREWSRFPSQRSETIFLKAGQSYYLEALQEQTTAADHLAVAWQGPTLKQSVIDGGYLSPWIPEPDKSVPVSTNGILWQYWTNYSAGDLSILKSTFASALSVEQMQVRVQGEGKMPEAVPMVLNRRLATGDNYRWVEVEGWARFTGISGGIASVELSDGEAVLEVRTRHWNPELLRRIHNSRVRVKGVCEGLYERESALVPGLIWATAEDGISPVETVKTNTVALTTEPSLNVPRIGTNPAMAGFYGTRGVVTFNGQVFGDDYLFVQEDDKSVLVSLKDHHFKSELKVGDWVELGGALQPGRNLPCLNPLIVMKLGGHQMPEPVRYPAPGNRDGRWTEVGGVVHSVNSNGTLSVLGAKGWVYFWLGQTSSNSLSRYVDAKVRARGVLSLSLLETPLLLVPSGSFIDVEEEASEDPFSLPVCSIAALWADVTESSSVHRTRVIGEITCQDDRSFFLQDASAGIRVQSSAPPAAKPGETVEVVGFPTISGPVRILTEALVRSAHTDQRVAPKKIEPGEVSSRQYGLLVSVDAEVIARETNETSQVLELQGQQRTFPATLSIRQDPLPAIAPGSRVRVTGVCDVETGALPVAGKTLMESSSVGSLIIRLRSPADVMVISGPPWWTWKRAAVLVGTLLTVLLATFLWVRLLQRRLERQQATQFAFSRQILKSLESERYRIAVNLHDSLGQILLAIKNQTLLAMQRVPGEPGLQQRLEEISGTTSQAIEEVRQITHGLRPYQLDRLGLTQAIRATVSRASASSSILFASRVDDIDTVFDKDSEIHVYRIVQEAVNNVIKHSGATEAAVVVRRQAGVISLSIRDNGRGFDANSTPASALHVLGYGLSGIAERVRILGGALTVNSKPGEGTSLAVEVPSPIHINDTRSNIGNRG